MLKSQEGDKKGRNKDDSSSMSGEFICRHHEGSRLKFHDPDTETFSIRIEIRRRNDTKSDEYKQWTARDSRSYVQDFLKDTSG